MAGAAVQWLRDGLHLIARADESGLLAAAADPEQAVYLVPAFTGLGAPWWDAHARGAMFGLTRNTGPKEFARAALDAVCFQTADLLDAMRADWQGASETVLRVDGGMVASDWMLQRLSDCSMRRWTGRWCWRPRRWARPGWRARVPGCGLIRTVSPKAGSVSAASRPRWMASRARVWWRDGAMPYVALCRNKP